MLVTVHPSALLRGDPGSREREFARWVEDLAVASSALAASGRRPPGPSAR